MDGSADLLKEKFTTLLGFFEAGDEDECQVYLDNQISSEIVISLVTSEDVAWVESAIEGYDEFPEVEQICEVKFDGVVVATFSRFYGAEMIDPTHTGLGGRWVGFRIDDPYSIVENLVEFLEIEIEEPDVPEPRKSE